MSSAVLQVGDDLVRQVAPTVADLARARGHAYRTFSALLLFPEHDRVCSLRRGMPKLQLAHAPFQDILHMRAFARVLRDVAQLHPASIAELQQQYTALFLTGAGPVRCPPYETAYLRRGGLDAGWVQAALQGAYVRAGLMPERTLTPDHAAVELDFVSFLCGKEAHSWESRDAVKAARWLRRERTFLIQHLGRWSGLLARRLAQADPGGFYASTANSAATFLTHDRSLIDGLLSNALTARDGSTR